MTSLSGVEREHSEMIPKFDVMVDRKRHMREVVCMEGEGGVLCWFSPVSSLT